MTRSIIIGAIVGGSIGAIGYDLEIIARGKASVWNYILVVLGVVGLFGVWMYIRWLRKQARPKL
jgi:uncharacterized membrane protein YuzA (DUF378 family)